MPVDLPALHDTDMTELHRLGREQGLTHPESMRRSNLVFEIARRVTEREGAILGRGVLEVHGEGFGFLRAAAANFLPGTDDIYVSQSQIRRFELKTGDTVIGIIRPPKEGERYTALLRVESVNGEPAGVSSPAFESLTAIYPDERIDLGEDPTLQVVELIAPLGLGQRGLLIAPPRTNRIEVQRRLVERFTADESLDVTILLTAAAPEEITEWRTLTAAEVIATPFDEPQARHLQVADIVFERARRMVERGDDVVVIVDSLTRLLRACLAELPPSGREIGGADAVALHRIRRYLGAARALEEGGSLTVIGVVSGDADNKLDQALLDDVRDAVNWELVLARSLTEQGLTPPIDVLRSNNRRAERLSTEVERGLLAEYHKHATGHLSEDLQALQTLILDRKGTIPATSRKTASG